MIGIDATVCAYLPTIFCIRRTKKFSVMVARPGAVAVLAVLAVLAV